MPYSISALNKLDKDETIMIINSDFEINLSGIYGYSKNLKGLQKLTLGFLTITQKLINSQGELEYLLAFAFEGSIEEIKVQGSELLPNKIGLLAIKGVPINHEHTKALSNALISMAQNLKSIPIQRKIGFYEDNLGNYRFSGVGNKLLLSNEVTNLFDVSLKGTLENELKTMKMLSVENKHVPLQLLYCLSLSALTIKVNQIRLGLDIFMPFYFLVNDSSLGKTTGLVAALSPFGNPDIKSSKSFIQPFSSTDVAIMSYASKMNGFTLGIDDFGSSVSKEKTELVYSITNAKSKSRGTSDGQVLAGESFSCCVIGTGEISLVDKLTSSGGAQLRCIEFTNLNFTKDAEHAESIKKQACLNYGHVSEAFANYLLTMPEDKLKTSYRQCLSNIDSKEYGDSSPKLGRYLKQLKVISQTAQLLNQYFDLSFDINSIEALLIKNFEEAIERLDYAKIAYQKFDNWVCSHINYFEKDDEEARNNGILYGQIKADSNGDNYVYLTKENLLTIIHELNLPEQRTFIKNLKSRGLLITDKDGKHSTIKIGNKRFYVIKVSN